MHVIACAKYQKASVKALVQIDVPVYALSSQFILRIQLQFSS